MLAVHWYKFLMKRTLCVLSAAAPLILAGCSSVSDNALYGKNGVIRDRAQDYEDAQRVPRIKVPEHLDDEAIRDVLIVPEVGTVASRSSEDFKVPRPDFFYAEAGNEVVNLARKGQEKLIVVEEPLPQVWQKVGDFWADHGIDVEIADPARGLMETTWISDDIEEPGFFTTILKKATFQTIDGPTRDKLRVKLAATDNRGQTSINMQHLRTSENETSAPDWSKGSRDVGYKSEMMYELLLYLSKATTTTTALALQQRKERGTTPALLGRDSNGNPVLKLTTDVERAWSWLGSAMTTAQMDVGSSDRDLGKYYITYTSRTPLSPDERSAFDRFVEWLNEEPEEIKISTDFLSDSFGVKGKDGKVVRYSARPEGEVDPNDLSQKEGYKIWVGGKVIYVFESGDGNLTRNEETGELEHTGRYQITLNRHRTGVYVSVLTDEEENAPSLIAEEILWNIKDSLPRG